RIGWVTGSAYEWVQHWRVGPGLGAPADDLLAVRDWRTSDRFGAPERAVLAATDDVLRDGRISAQTWRECEEALGADEPALVELVCAIGGWHMISVILESLEVPLEDGLEPWPPDGVAPEGVTL
ncbi:MAG TPA: carboxymuconolactone decarboxylase family protein, partial [Acidimicrobiia bacterium]|nr:carboxymuconolactone decarboxylase family protein [Acidimicrobiia bacterium]